MGAAGMALSRKRLQKPYPPEITSLGVCEKCTHDFSSLDLYLFQDKCFFGAGPVTHGNYIWGHDFSCQFFQKERRGQGTYSLQKYLSWYHPKYLHILNLVRLMSKKRIVAKWWRRPQAKWWLWVIVTAEIALEG